MILVNILFAVFIFLCAKKLRKEQAGLKSLIACVAVWLVANAILIGQQTWNETKWLAVQNEFCIITTRPE